MNLIQKSLHKLTRLISLSENSITILVLLSMASFPLVQAVARVFGVQGIPGSSVIVQHLTLWIGFLGAIIAARENRLLSLTQPVEIQVNKKKDVKFWFAQAIASIICMLLAYASFLLVKTESEYPRDLIPGIPVWLVEVIMPIGFFLIGLEILRKNRRERIFQVAFFLLAILAISFGELGTKKSEGLLKFSVIYFIAAALSLIYMLLCLNKGIFPLGFISKYSFVCVSPVRDPIL